MSFNSSNNILQISNLPHQIDIAVITQNAPEFTLKTYDEHVIDLDPIYITENIFKEIFYSNNAFSITPKSRLSKKHLYHTCFLQRTVNNSSFILIDTIIKYIESDLSITKDMISTTSFINLNKIINSIRNLCDLNLSNITSALNWNELVHSLSSNFGNKNVTPEIMLTVSVMFLSPTDGVKPIIIKFNYITTITLV